MKNILSQIQIASHVAVISVLGLIPKIDLPFLPGVPITAQTLGVMLAGAMLGFKNAISTVAIFLSLVVIGAPLLSGGRGGLSVFFSPSAGYLFGWLVGVGIISLIMEFLVKKFSIYWACFFSSFIGGILVIHFFGIFGLTIITDLKFKQAFYLSLAFVPGDIVKCFLASFVLFKLSTVIKSK